MKLIRAAIWLTILGQWSMQTIAEVSIYDQKDFGTYDRSLNVLRRDFSDDIPFYLSVPKDQPL
ncbi:MAG: hypothetical protein JKY88_12770 [Pseudomonadales bacterium]|nr:hypothetical protein [Pseudomonadales bacterium]